MTDEERKAIEYYTNNEYTFGFETDMDMEHFKKALGIEETEEDTFEKHQMRFKTLLKLINKQDKAIDRMAEVINTSYRNAELINTLMEKRICTKLIEPEKEESDCYFDVYKKDACKECIKEYFMEDK